MAGITQNKLKNVIVLVILRVRVADAERKPNNRKKDRGKQKVSIY